MMAPVAWKESRIGQDNVFFRSLLLRIIFSSAEDGGPNSYFWRQVATSFFCGSDLNPEWS